jgi:hypothetical protein
VHARTGLSRLYSTKTKVCDCPVGSIGDGGSIGGAGRLLLRCHGRAQRAEHPTLHAGRGSVGRELALSSLYRPSPPRNPSLASVSCREWRVRRAVGGSAAEPSEPSDDTLHLDRPEQLAGFQMAHGIAAPQPGVLHQLQELNPSGTAINPPETARSRPAARCTRQEGLEEKAPPAARPAARATSHDRATRPTLVAPSAPRRGWMVKSARQMKYASLVSIDILIAVALSPHLIPLE